MTEVLSVLDFGIVLLYLAGMLVIGAVVSRRIVSFRDYFVAGGRMTTALLVCTLVSMYYGLDVLFGGSEVSYQEGLVAWFVYLRPYYVAILIAALFIAKRLRQHDFLSLPDIGGHFYGNGTRVLFAVASFLYSLPILSIMGIGIVLDLALQVPFVWGVLIGAGVSVAYTVMGGVVADALTDTVQFVLMCVTLSVAAVAVLGEAGGADAVWERLPDAYLDPMGTYPAGVLIVFASSALSAMVEPAFYQRIFAAVSYRAVLTALLIGIVLWAAFDWVVTVVGMAAAARGMEVEPRYALLTLTLEVLPRGMDGLFVAGVLACAMSTIDSYLLIAGGNIAYDIYRPPPDSPRASPGSWCRWRITWRCTRWARSTPSGQRRSCAWSLVRAPSSCGRNTGCSRPFRRRRWRTRLGGSSDDGRRHDRSGGAEVLDLGRDRGVGRRVAGRVRVVSAGCEALDEMAYAARGRYSG